jgi:hypothetical protein
MNVHNSDLNGMAKNKTTETGNSVEAFINTMTDGVRRNDSFRIAELFRQSTGFEPRMWGPGIVGFGSYHYKYESGREGDAPLAAFAPRKDSFALYVGMEADLKDQLLEKIGKHKTAKGCVYIRRLDDIDVKVLEQLIRASVAEKRQKYPERRGT